jgi:2-keto-3-deoxy-galactonokinase
LLIGGEIAEMAARGPLPARIPLIGNAGLAKRYARALATNGRTAQPLDAQAVTLAGLALLDGDLSDGHD